MLCSTIALFALASMVPSANAEAGYGFDLTAVKASLASLNMAKDNLFASVNDMSVDLHIAMEQLRNFDQKARRYDVEIKRLLQIRLNTLEQQLNALIHAVGEDNVIALETQELNDKAAASAASTGTFVGTIMSDLTQADTDINGLLISVTALSSNIDFLISNNIAGQLIGDLGPIVVRIEEADDAQTSTGCETSLAIAGDTFPATINIVYEVDFNGTNTPEVIASIVGFRSHLDVHDAAHTASYTDLMAFNVTISGESPSGFTLTVDNNSDPEVVPKFVYISWSACYYYLNVAGLSAPPPPGPI